MLAPDLYGYGESSPWLGARPICADDEAEILVALARRIGRPFHLVGHSYGGTISLVAAPRLGERLLSLTLIEPSAFHLLAEDLCEGDTWDEIALLGRDHRALVRAGALREAADLFMSYWIGGSRWAAVPAERRLAITALMPKVAEEWGMMFETPMRVADVAAIEVPALLVYGSATARAIRRVLQLLARKVKGCRLDILLEQRCGTKIRAWSL